MFMVNVLNSEEAVMNAESITKIFNDFNKAQECFENEVNNVCNFLGVEDINNNELIRENGDNRFVVYDDERGYGCVIELFDINMFKEEQSIITKF